MRYTTHGTMSATSTSLSVSSTKGNTQLPVAACIRRSAEMAIFSALACTASDPLSAQPFNVPCTAPDSVVAMYQDDADRLALDRSFRNGTTWTDSVAIDTAWSRTAMNALIAVYNSTLPARDTVVDMLDIHMYPHITMELLAVTADSTLPWMQQLRMGVTPTGTPGIDDLMSSYGVLCTGYYVWPWGAHTAVFDTQTNVNIPALCALFAAQPGVHYAEPNGGCCDGNTITDSVYTDHVNLVYSRGWGDCPSGCTERRFWEFNVLPDCSVEFVSSYGSALQLPTLVHTAQRPALKAYPNPCNDHVQLDGVVSNRIATVYTSDGRIIISNSVTAGRLDTRPLQAGAYWLRLEGLPAFAPLMFVKE